MERTTTASNGPVPGRSDRGWLGPLEWRVLEALWARAGAASVRDLTPAFSDIAYTTLMTTLERLYRKGLLGRRKDGRAFYYEPVMSRAQFHAARAARAFRTALAGAAPNLLLSYLVEEVSQRDRALLDELAALVEARRAEHGEEPS